jgi:uncharacterized alpha-E superfamily protein
MTQHTLSRTAERVYWLGRYLERSESTARLIMVTSNLLIDLPHRRATAWRSLLDIMGDNAQFEELYDAPDERSVVRFMAADTRYSGSLVSSLEYARENARTIREIMPRVSFEYINDLYLQARTDLSGTLSRTRVMHTMDQVMRRAQHIDGFLAGSMIHGSAWHFLRMGQFLERADMTTRIIDVRSVDMINEGGGELEPYAQLQWRSVLRSLHSMQSYHLSVGQPVAQPLVLDFLFRNPELPRGFLYCLLRIRNSLRSLPRNDKPLAAVNRVIRFTNQTDTGKLESHALHSFIDECQLKLHELDRVIDRTYFHARLRVNRRRKKS